MVLLPKSSVLGLGFAIWRLVLGRISFYGLANFEREMEEAWFIMGLDRDLFWVAIASME